MRAAPGRTRDLPRLTRTMVHITPAQAAHFARLRTQRKLQRTAPPAGWLASGAVPDAWPGWPPGFRPSDAALTGHWPSAADLRAGRIRLLGVTRDLGDPPAWDWEREPLLWRFHLHYWDWACGLAAEPDRLLARAVFARLWRSWSERVPPGTGDGWLPYPAALRAWSWCGQYAALVAGSEFERPFAALLARHAVFIRRNLERDLGGNHLLKDLKALAGLGVFFADERLVRFAVSRLTSQLPAQVLPDGGHYERAPAYHCQVLADLADVAGLLAASGRPVPAELTQATVRMRRWLGAVLGPDGRVPLRGDGYPVPAELIAALRPVPSAAGALQMLEDTGLARLTAHGWHVLACVGDPGEPALAGHAHADTLGFFAWLDGQPVLVDTGTSTYEPGPCRDYERSTAAHNTAVIDGADSTEVWGGFRTGRRARVHAVTTTADAGTVCCAASHDGYRWLAGSPVHRRRWSLSATGLRVEDTFTGGGRHEIQLGWHLDPAARLRVIRAGAGPANAASAVVMTGAGELLVDVTSNSRIILTAGERPAALGFGVTAGAPVLTGKIDADLPVQVTTTWRRAHGATVPTEEP
jgi:uncharacterized heparinase superfamily protein